MNCWPTSSGEFAVPAVPLVVDWAEATVAEAARMAAVAEARITSKCIGRLEKRVGSVSALVLVLCGAVTFAAAVKKGRAV